MGNGRRVPTRHTFHTHTHTVKGKIVLEWESSSQRNDAFLQYKQNSINNNAVKSHFNSNNKGRLHISK